MATTGPSLTPRRLAVLQQAAAHPSGGIMLPGGRGMVSARDEEALEALGYAASIDDCGHVRTGSDSPADREHNSHPHFFRITEAGRAAVQAAGRGDVAAGASLARAARDAR